MSTYFCLLTAIGQASIANAVALNEDVQLAEMAVGDGNGNPITPLATMTELVNEVYRIPVNTIYVDPQDAGHVIAEMVIPSNQGGWTVREVGLFDANGDLFAVGSLPDSVKPATGEGAGAEMTVRMHLTMSAAQAEAIELKIDPTIVLSTRQYVDESIATHSADGDAHPDKADVGHTHNYEPRTATDTIYIGCGAMTPSVTNGASIETVEDATNGLSRTVGGFANDADSSLEFDFIMPSNWDLGTVFAQIGWTAPTASAGDEVRFTLAGVAVNDGEALDAALGAAVNVDDAVVTAGASHTSGASAAMTVGGTPATGCRGRFKLTRDADYGTQPLTDVVQGLGILITYGKA